MNEITFENKNNTQISFQNANSAGQYADNGNIIDAHYSNNMKVKRPNLNPDAVKINIPAQKVIYTDKQANEKYQQLSNDIYEGQKKEKKNHGFSVKTYLKILCGIVFAIAGYTGIRKLIQYFKK